DPFLQIDADRTHVADDLSRRFFHREIDTTMTGRAGRVDKMRGYRRFATAGHAGHQNAGAFEVAFALQHLVEIRNAGRQPLGRRLMGETARCDRHHGDALLVDTVMPCSSMMNGYSLVPCAEPRYLTMRRRRVESWSCTRLSRRITQSAT